MRTVTVGGILLDQLTAASVRFTADVVGWLDGPPVRPGLQPKAQQDGAWDGSGASTERVLDVAGFIEEATPAAADAALRELTALRPQASYEVVVDHPDVGVLACMARLMVPARSSWSGDCAFEYTLTLAAPDPLLYGPPTYDSASLASATPATVRTNLCTNPSFEVGITGWRGIGGRTADGPVGTGSWAGTHTGLANGGFYVGTGAGVFSGGSGEVVSTLIWAKAPIGRSFQMRVTFRNAGGAVVAGGDVYSSPAEGTGEWSSYSVTTTAPADATITNYEVGLQATTDWLTNDVLAIAALLVVEGSYSGPYFDGDTPDTAEIDYAWTGTANASTSAAWSGSGRRWPRVWPTDWGIAPGVTLGAVAVPNAGTATYWTRLRIDGPVLNPVVSLVETGAWVRFGGSLLAGQWLDFDMANRRVLLQGHVSVREKVTSSGNWLAISPGGGSVVWTADTADPAALLHVFGYERAVS